MTLDNKKVVVGVSGGVDSASTVLILQGMGYKVSGMFFDVLYDENTKGYEDAKDVAKQLGIDLTYINVADKFETSVIHEFCKQYSNGYTPNPCVLCNPTIKFQLLLEEADRCEAFYIATGHYASKGQDPMTGVCHIAMGNNEKKDQSYMLYALPEKTVKRMILPLGEVENKAQVRALAYQNNLRNAEKKDSQDICFIDGDYVDFLKGRGVECMQGNFVDLSNNVLGAHKGIYHYTVGQRKGLGYFGKPMYVVSIDKTTGNVILGGNQDLFTQTVLSHNNFFTQTGSNLLPEHLRNTELTAKIRYSSKPAIGKISQKNINGERIVIFQFKDPQRGPAPGQSVVFYKDKLVIGGGVIMNSQINTL